MTQPADAVLSGYFRAHRELGQHDRAFIAETVFGVLRRRYGLEYHTGAATPRRLLLAWLNRVQGVSLRQLEPLLGRDDALWAAALKATPELASPLYVAAELPPWLVAMLAAEMPEGEILALGRALAQPAPLDLRVNALLTTREKVLRQLIIEGINAQPTPHAPLGIRIDGNPALGRNPLFTSGRIEVQDEGSQLLCYLLAPKRREMVVDFCAGAGGKTLALGVLMQSQGRLYAFDVSEARLNKFKPRLKRSGLSNVHPQLLASENDLKVKRLAGKIDRVLVDAPCSGFGTLRRNPDLKWRQSEAGIAELAAKQRAILTAAAALLKPGGRLVYATCSFLRAENQDIVAAFLAAHPHFSLVPANEVLKQQHIALDTGEFLQLYPHRHGCDGFFAAVMARAA
ncbi:MAG: RsmB/NOP family class I SAM-dependent RNA methyltransferase [Betaproteobacteria bacterium]|nr:RsmB/NOP family class I SAM-dependent RNA methyltransferase [Betaproteobacteria bacterium]